MEWDEFVDDEQRVPSSFDGGEERDDFFSFDSDNEEDSPANKRFRIDAEQVSSCCILLKKLLVFSHRNIGVFFCLKSYRVCV